MLVFSKHKRYRILVRGEETEFIPLDNGTFHPRVLHEQAIEFYPLHEPIPWNLPDKHLVKGAQGVFDSSKPSNRPGMSEEEAIDVILTHPDYGKRMLAVDDKGNWIDKVDFLRPVGSQMYCSLCDKYLDKRGSHKHPESKEHQAKLAENKSGGGE